MAACNQYSKLGLPESPTLFIEFHGTHAGVAEQVEAQAPVHLRSGGGGERCGQHSVLNQGFLYTNFDFFYKTSQTVLLVLTFLYMMFEQEADLIL